MHLGMHILKNGYGPLFKIGRALLLTQLFSLSYIEALFAEMIYIYVRPLSQFDKILSMELASEMCLKAGCFHD